jgi:hypothetical protein
MKQIKSMRYQNDFYPRVINYVTGKIGDLGTTLRIVLLSKCTVNAYITKHNRAGGQGLVSNIKAIFFGPGKGQSISLLSLAV